MSAVSLVHQHDVLRLLKRCFDLEQNKWSAEHSLRKEYQKDARTLHPGVHALFRDARGFLIQPTDEAQLLEPELQSHYLVAAGRLIMAEEEVYPAGLSTAAWCQWLRHMCCVKRIGLLCEL